MKERFKKAVLETTELRALLILGLLLCLRAWRAIPKLRPTQLLLPATLLQMIVFVIAALNKENFLIILAIGNFIIVGLAMLPSTFIRPKASVEHAAAEK